MPTRSGVCTGNILTNGNAFMYLSHGNRWLSSYRDETEVERCEIDTVGFILKSFRNLNTSLIASGPKNRMGSTRGSRTVLIYAKVRKGCNLPYPSAINHTAIPAWRVGSREGNGRAVPWAECHLGG